MQIISSTLSVSMAPSPLEPSHKGNPWPEYFLVRITGEVVPLIAVDELPAGIDLVGVPRSLNLEETIGMLNLGLQQSTGSYQIISDREVKTEHGNLISKSKWAILLPSQLRKSLTLEQTLQPHSLATNHAQVRSLSAYHDSN